MMTMQAMTTMLTKVTIMMTMDDHDAHEGHDHDDHAGHDHDHDDEYRGKAILEESGQEITALLVQFRNKKNFRALNLGRNINENTDLMAISTYEVLKLQEILESVWI